MSEVKIRKAREDELPVLKELSNKTVIEELDEYELQEKDRIVKEDLQRLDVFYKKEGNEFYVAEAADSKEMAGFVWFGVSERPFSRNKIGWIYDIEVLPSFRGKGVGEALMRHALRVSVERGLVQVGLMVNAKNKVAQGLYEKLGFETEAKVMTRREGNPLSA